MATGYEHGFSLVVKPSFVIDTANIAFDATLDDVKARLEEDLDTVTAVTVAFVSDVDASTAGQTKVCLARKGSGLSAVPIRITFTTTMGRQGDIHELQIISSLTSASNEKQMVKN